jgi:hypothetical protein
MNNPYAEPKNGDYVAYLEQIERRQLAQAAALASKQPAPPAAPATTRSDKGGGATPAPLSRQQAEALLEKLKSGEQVSTFDLAELRKIGVPAAIAVALIIFGQFVEGGGVISIFGFIMLIGVLRPLFKLLAAIGKAAR